MNLHGTYVTLELQWWGQDTDVRREIFVYNIIYYIIIQYLISRQYSAVIAFRASTVSDNRSGRNNFLLASVRSTLIEPVTPDKNNSQDHEQYFFVY